MYYFGYGSNMLTSRLQARVSSAKPVMSAELSGCALRFHKRSRDGSGKCNIVESKNERVYGVVFDVDPNELEALDEAEQRGRGYKRINVSVHGESSVQAFAYEAQPAYVDDALLPYEWYHSIVVAGARQHNLPAQYIAEISTVRSFPDPNAERRRKYQNLLESAGYSLLRS